MMKTEYAEKGGFLQRNSVEHEEYRERTMVADHLGFCPKCYGIYELSKDDYDVIRYVYADKKGDFFIASAGEWIMKNTNREHIPKYMAISL